MISKLIPRYIREQKRYTQKELFETLDCSSEAGVLLIRKLKEFGVLKAVKASDPQKSMTDLCDEDIEVADVEPNEEDLYYVFTFVGVIVFAGRVLKCYPKYLLHVEQPKNELRQILKVLEKYNAKEQIIRMFNDSSEDSTFNLLAVLLFFIQDYYENGLYSNTEEIIENNGTGEILWDKTINETFTLLSNNRPYYTDLQTKKKISNDFDYFRRLHECVLTKASKELRDADLLDLFEITEVDLTDGELDDLGGKDYILYRIDQELNTQFNTRKQLLLKTIYAYIALNGSLYDADCLSLFGTNSFNLVWEKVCAEILNNQLKVELGALPMPLLACYDKKMLLINLIEKPLWSATGETATDTLTPDLVTIRGRDFFIFDAKYYTAKLDYGCAPKGQPGIESVTKQYLYQLAYQRFIKDHGFNVWNCFLLPTENNELENRGEVSLKMLSTLGLQDIKIRFLPAKVAYDHYLIGKKMNVDYLKLNE